VTTHTILQQYSPCDPDLHKRPYRKQNADDNYAYGQPGDEGFAPGIWWVREVRSDAWRGRKCAWVFARISAIEALDGARVEQLSWVSHSRRDSQLQEMWPCRSESRWEALLLLERQYVVHMGAQKTLIECHTLAESIDEDAIGGWKLTIGNTENFPRWFSVQLSTLSTARLVRLPESLEAFSPSHSTLRGVRFRHCRS
jgi:hypothetical protein